MLGDSVEAAARSLEKPSREQLAEMISAIFSDKIEDGQLDDCDLTFRDLKCISDAFLHVLTALLHGRIEYPKVLAPGSAAPSAEFSHASQAIQDAGPGVAAYDAASREEADIPMESVDSTDCDLPGEPPGSIEMFEALNYLQTGESGGSGKADSPSPMMPLVETEVLYGRPAAERPSAPDPDNGIAPGSPPRPRGGRPRARRS